MLKLSKLTDYGTAILAQMAAGPGEVYSVAALAESLDLAPATTSKVLKRLARKGLVASRRGSAGGYLLARAPAEISMADVVEAMEGRFGLTECSVASGLCRKESHCRVRGTWQQLNDVVRLTLSQTTLAQMASAALARPLAVAAPVRVPAPQASKV